MIDAENSRSMREVYGMLCCERLIWNIRIYHGFAGRIGAINDFRRMLFEYTKG